LAFVMTGAVGGYLWYNAAPSQALMGDAGSRPLGLLIGLLVAATGNPFFLLMVGLVIVLNGATGWVKVAMIRFFRIRVLHTIRFPLHDHARKELNWSNTQVLVRFMLLHLGLSALLITLVLKVR
jgi:phospho-N-acetylmuramoyl-pentapeptide-transferase